MTHGEHSRESAREEDSTATARGSESEAASHDADPGQSGQSEDGSGATARHGSGETTLTSLAAADGAHADDARLSFFLNTENWPLFYHTARNMESEQLLGVAERKLRHLAVPTIPIDFDARYENRVPTVLSASAGPIRANLRTLRQSLSAEQKAQCLDRARALSDGRVTFCNETVQIDGGDGPAWLRPTEDGLLDLWSVKFWSFEFLDGPLFGAQTPRELPSVDRTVRRWLRHWDRSASTRIGAPAYLRRLWTPYSVSLRLVNWCRYYAWHEQGDADPAFLNTLGRLLFKNALFLENHVEHDVGGNHLIENGVALVAAGVLFRNTSEGQRWLDAGRDILVSTSEQFLADGGHFEHSPMYHTIVLTRYLTARDLLQEAGESCPPAVEGVTRRATAFLRSMRPPDGRIPLLNDAVYREALPADDCLAYAEAVGVEVPSTGRDSLPASGYYWLGEGDNRLLVDGGRFGPPHLPAHSHNDFLSVLLWVDGTQVLTDTGTYNYDPTARRTYARSVRAHNTVQVGESEPVPIGGRYLAGRRIQPSVRYRQTDEFSVFDGRYRRRPRRGVAYSHRRRICAGGDWWLIRDTATSDRERPVRSRLHLHPAVSAEDRSDGDGFELTVGSEPLAYVLPTGYDEVETVTRPYFPEFGTVQHRQTLCFQTSTDSKATGRGESTGLLLSTEPYSRSEYHRLEAVVCDSAQR